MRLVEPAFKQRVWGRRDLSDWYPQLRTSSDPIGEAWLTPGECPVLVKLLFPRERLSVQVHPDDAYAAAHGLGRGKSEAWFVVSAEPGAQVGVGLRAGATFAELETACRTGHGAGMLHWFEVRAGDVIHVPAGTVHAIGGGSVLLEVQQPSDTTFRLDDYGRGRELHLEAGMAVACQTDGGRCVLATSGPLLSTAHFRLWRWESPVRIEAAGETRWLVSLSGSESIPKGCLAELSAGEEFESPQAGIIMEVRAGQNGG